MASHADNHDRDKLLRWQQDLTNASAGAPPVYAIFLVSEADTRAHDIFRAFRSSFEEGPAGFAHLVIFGQHGISATVRGLQGKLAPNEGALPLLALYTGSQSEPELIPLPAGPGTEDTGPRESAWQAALRRAEARLASSVDDRQAVRDQVLQLCLSLV